MSAQGGTTEEDGRGTEAASTEALEHRNPFLMPEAEAAVMRAPAKRRISRFGTRAVITRLIAWPALLIRPVAGRPHAIRRGLLAVAAVSACAAVVTGIAVHTGTHARSDPTQSTQSAAAIASLDRLSGTSLHITLRAAPAIPDPNIEGPRQPRPPTAQSPDTRFASAPRLRLATRHRRLKLAAQPARQRRRSKAARQRARARSSAAGSTSQFHSNGVELPTDRFPPRDYAGVRRRRRPRTRIFTQWMTRPASRLGGGNTMRAILTHLRGNVVAYIALFIALGGTSYAAFSLPAGSVGDRQLQNHAIDPVKLNPATIGASIRAWADVTWDGAWTGPSIQQRHPHHANGLGEVVSWRHTRFARNCMASVTPERNVPGPGGSYSASTATSRRRSTRRMASFRSTVCLHDGSASGPGPLAC